MRKDKYHTEMEDLSAFLVERSRDCEEWEEVSQEELNDLLDQVPDERARNFLSVVPRRQHLPVWPPLLPHLPEILTPGLNHAPQLPSGFD